MNSRLVWKIVGCFVAVPMLLFGATQTAQALVHSRHDMQVILRFAHRVTLAYAVLVAILFYTPMREVILGGIMGLPETLRAYAAPGVQMVLLVVIAWGYASLFRGMLSAMRAAR